MQTTYENFRYRADNRINVYNRGCLNNFLEVFCTKVKPSRNNFRAFVQEEVPRPPPPVISREPEPDLGGGDPRSKVEDDQTYTINAVWIEGRTHRITNLVKFKITICLDERKSMRDKNEFKILKLSSQNFFPLHCLIFVYLQVQSLSLF